MSKYMELRATAKIFSDDMLAVCLQEMRDRGWAVAAYASGDIAEMFDVQESDAMREWFKLERDDIEEAMCEAARSIFWNECPSVGND